MPDYVHKLQSLVIFLTVMISLVYYPWTMEVTRVKTLIGFVCIGLIVTGYVFFGLLRREFLWNRSPLLLPVVLFVAWNFLTFTWSEFPWSWTGEIFRIVPALCLSHSCRQSGSILRSSSG